MTNNILFLDIDGPLTTAQTRGPDDVTKFEPAAVAAIEYLCAMAQPMVIVHSSWRKLPEPPPVNADPDSWTYPPDPGWWYWDFQWFKWLCHKQGAANLSGSLAGTAPYTLSSGRGLEVDLWLADNDLPDNRYVILDDEPEYFDYFLGADGKRDYAVRTKLITCDDHIGLTMDQANEALAHFRGD